MKSPDKLLSIIVVSYNTGKLLYGCLKSVYEAINTDKLSDNTEIIVVDNASNDGSSDLVRKSFSRVHLIQNEKNIGFAAANNRGMKSAKGKYILLLNSDTWISAGVIPTLINLLERDKTLGVAGPRLLNSDKSLQQSAGYAPDLLNVFFWMTFIDDLWFLNYFLRPYHIGNKQFYSKNALVGWVSGACMILKKEAIDKSGYLDEKIFMYGEEVEWCERIIKNGYKVLFTGETEIIHHKGASGEGKMAGIIEEFRFIKYFFGKNKPRWQYPFLKFLLRAGALLRVILFGIIMGNSGKYTIYAKAFKMV